MADRIGDVITHTNSNYAQPKVRAVTYDDLEMDSMLSQHMQKMCPWF